MIAEHIKTLDHRVEASRDEAGADSRLRVTVVFTTAEATINALHTASVFAKSLAARIALVALEAVPYRLPLEQPPVPLECFERKMLALVSRAELEAEEISIEICMCRDRRHCLRQILLPGSSVVIGGKNSPWSKERKLEKWLTSLGHHVVFVEVHAKSAGNSVLRRLQDVLRVSVKERDLTGEKGAITDCSRKVSVTASGV